MDTKQVLTSMERLFKDFERGEITPLPAFEVSQPKESARFEIEEDINQTHPFFGFPVPPLNFQDSAALEVLQAILDGAQRQTE